MRCIVNHPCTNQSVVEWLKRTGDKKNIISIGHFVQREGSFHRSMLCHMATTGVTRWCKCVCVGVRVIVCFMELTM